MFDQIFAQLGHDIHHVATGLKNITITHERVCDRCDGTGKMFPRIRMKHSPVINSHLDNDFDVEDETKMIECTRCKGKGGIETVMTINVTREPIKEKKK
jgi:RecJ-like exonuclease